MTSRRRSKVIVARDRDEMARLAAEWICDKARHAVRARGRFTLALAGGRTPRPAYDVLGSPEYAERFPWMETEFFFGDERAVPLDHEESNYRLVRETLLRSRPDALGRVFRMPADAPDRDEAAERYGRRLPDPLDLVLLGMGEDGHTASLFPGSPALDERERRVVVVTAPKPPPERMTITPPVLQRARQILVLVSGVEKAPVLARALGGAFDPKALPAQLARHGTWIVDSGAASGLL
jgi:6-phosphogluconolactonase